MIDEFVRMSNDLLISAKERKEQLQVDLDEHIDELKRLDNRLSRPGQNRATIQ